MIGRRRGFTAVELTIVLSLFTILDTIGILFIVRFLNASSEVSERSRVVVESHLFLERLREDVTESTGTLSHFQDIQASTGCLILKSGSVRDRCIVYRMEEGELRRSEYGDPDQRLLRSQSMLCTGQLTRFRIDSHYPEIIWVRIERSSPSRSSNRRYEQLAAFYLPAVNWEGTQ